MAKSKSVAVSIDIGINEKDRAKIAEGLSRLLADTYSLYLKTHYFHWNVTGPMFQTLNARSGTLARSHSNENNVFSNTANKCPQANAINPPQFLRDLFR